MTIFIIILILLLVFCFIVWTKFRARKKQPINLFSGRNGGGKSFNMSIQSVRDVKSSIRYWKHYNKPFFSWIYLWIPYFNKKRKNNEQYNLDLPEIYTSYPIEWKKGVYSKPITLEIMLLQKSIPLNSIVVIDEFSSWINQFEFKENFSDVLNDHIQKWRHYHGNKSRLYIADQCTNNIPIQVRYRCNSAICCLETKHYLKFIHITKYKNIDLTDAIKNVEIVDNDNSDTDDKTLRMISFGFRRIYDDRAYSNRYFYVDENPKNSKLIDSPLKVNSCLEKPDKKATYISIDDKLKK